MVKRTQDLELELELLRLIRNLASVSTGVIEGQIFQHQCEFFRGARTTSVVHALRAIFADVFIRARTRAFCNHHLMQELFLKKLDKRIAHTVHLLIIHFWELSGDRSYENFFAWKFLTEISKTARYSGWKAYERKQLSQQDAPRVPFSYNIEDASLPHYIAAFQGLVQFLCFLQKV